VIALTLGEVAAVVGGSLNEAAEAADVVTSVVIDSRRASAGSLFVALPGEHEDGHDHAGAAVDAGAVAVLAARPLPLPAVLVDDPLFALGRLARGSLDRLPDITVIGLTGSSGKTTTKDLLAAVLQTLGPTVAPVGSFNNEIGVPLTALLADPSTRYLVVEMGARGSGHISYLCGITPPRLGVVLNVGMAHLGEFGSIAGVAKAKRELVEALPSAANGGVAVLNADDAVVAAMTHGTRARVVTFGHSRESDVRADGVALDSGARAAFGLVTPAGAAPVQLRVPGAHQVSNALAVAAVALEVGAEVDDVARALSATGIASRWRMEVVDRADGVTVINDAYNANPDSMRAALEALAVIGAGTRRTWAVLGEMLELGAASADEHAAIGRLAMQLHVSRLVVVGVGARPAFDAASSTRRAQGEETVLVADAEAALALVREQVRPGDVVLVKASRRAGLDRVANGLLRESA
jgi:UDP-N-acetylmuramoyl-tripeptide--D-alanyl-D-alanine ligase